jgi:hypothetical protein
LRSIQDKIQDTPPEFVPADLPSLERLLRPRGPTGLVEIAAGLGCSTKTAQRLIATAGDAVVSAGQIRRRRTAWRRDFHGGNLGFFHDGAGLRLAPSYDQLPMRYAPLAGGEVLSPPLAPTLPTPAERERWLRVAPRALAFWQAAATDERISPAFRALCADNHAALERAAALA